MSILAHEVEIVGLLSPLHRRLAVCEFRGINHNQSSESGLWEQQSWD
jgi:hypothetical protein